METQPSLTLDTISKLLAELGPPPPRPNIIHLCCSYDMHPHWMHWLAEQFKNQWSRFPIYWHDSINKGHFSSPGFLVVWTDDTISWTPFECKLSEKP